MKTWLIQIQLALLTVTRCHLQICDDIKTLKTTLFNGTDSELVPNNNPDGAISVSLGFILLSVNDVDVTGQSLSVVGLVHMQWTDELHKWNPSQHANQTSLRMKTMKIWSPDVIVANSITRHLPLERAGNLAVLYHTGLVDYVTTTDFKTSCEMDITTFPFDTQLCNIIFIPSSSYEVVLNSGNITKYTDYEEYAVNRTEWELAELNISGQLRGHRSLVKVILTVKRKATFYVLTIIVPLFLLSLANVSTFLVPLQSGEKISYAVSIMLSYSVYFSLVIGIMPRTSASVSIVTILLVTLFVLSIIATVGAITVQRWFHRTSESRVPSWVQFLLRMDKHSSNEHADIDLRDAEGKIISQKGSFMHYREAEMQDETHIPHVESPESNPLGQKSMNNDVRSCEQNMKINWVMAAVCLDKTLLLLLGVSTILLETVSLCLVTMLN